MPSGVYFRTEKAKERLKTLRAGKSPWNKGVRGKQPWHNLSGLNKGAPWNKGMKGFLAGEQNSRWIKDRTKVVARQERNDSLYCSWRSVVYRRDGWKCKINNADCYGRIIAHHILGWASFPELRYEINNGI